MLRTIFCVICFTLGAPVMARPTEEVRDYKTVTQPRTHEENHRETPRVLDNHRLLGEVRAGRMTMEEAIRQFRKKYPDSAP